MKLTFWGIVLVFIIVMFAENTKCESIGCLRKKLSDVNKELAEINAQLEKTTSGCCGCAFGQVDLEKIKNFEVRKSFLLKQKTALKEKLKRRNIDQVDQIALAAFLAGGLINDDDDAPPPPICAFGSADTASGKK